MGNMRKYSSLWVMQDLYPNTLNPLNPKPSTLTRDPPPGLRDHSHTKGLLHGEPVSPMEEPRILTGLSVKRERTQEAPRACKGLR